MATMTLTEMGVAEPAEVPPPTKLTPEDLLAMPDAGRFELVDGELLERKMSVLSGIVAVLISRRLVEHCQEHGLGWVLDAEVGYRCFPWDRRKLRRPDVSFLPATRYSLAQATREGHASIAPDLAVEVISPGDEVVELNRKLEDYRRAGVRLVWVVDPESRIVDVHALDGSLVRLREGDELSGGDVVPGFRCLVAAVFPPEREEAVPGPEAAPN
jgi:Uma2 family endonuclease